MNHLPAQFQVLAQGDADQWIDLLIIVVIGVFYAIAGLIRAARRKSQEARQARSGGVRPATAESWQQRLARKAEEIQRAVEAKGREAVERIERLEQQAHTRESRPQPGKIVVRPGRGGEPAAIHKRDESGGDMVRSQHTAREQRLKEAVIAAGREATTQSAEVLLQPISPGELGTAVAAPVSERLGYEATEILDPSDPDALRKAILHYEILGKPMSLRDPCEQGNV